VAVTRPMPSGPRQKIVWTEQKDQVDNK
jgi:hypothetical protein